MSVRRAITFVLAIIVVLVMWRAAEGTTFRRPVELQTTFDFDRYPACAPTVKNNCIVAIRFYDGVSGRIIATAPTRSRMTGRQVMTATVGAGKLAQSVYAVTVYLDQYGHSAEGPHGQTSKYGFQEYLPPQK